MIRWHLIALLAAGILFAAVPADGNAAPPNQVWVAPHTLPNGTVVPGFWRATASPGYVWIEGRSDAQGRWIPGHWRPVGDPARDKAWAAGYWEEGVWHPGRWVTSKPDQIWVAGHYDARHRRFAPGRWR
jgi:hypothetical protein